MEKTIQRIRLYLLDMDGTLYLGDRLYDFTKELLSEILAKSEEKPHLVLEDAGQILQVLKTLPTKE